MSHTRHESRLEITRLDGDDLRIICTLTMPPEEALEAQRHPQPSLVMDFSGPTCVVWRLDTPPDAWSEVSQDASDRPPTSRPDGVRLRFSYALEATEEVAAFFPPDGSAYVAKVEIDWQARTAWFPLPVGQSIHSLERPLGFEDRSLLYVVADWFGERDDRAPHPIRVDDNVSYYDEDGFYINC